MIVKGGHAHIVIQRGHQNLSRWLQVALEEKIKMASMGSIHGSVQVDDK